MKPRMILFAALALGTATAQAGDWYALGMVSHSNAKLNKSASDSALTSAGVTGLNSSTDETSNKWRLQLGYQFNDNLAVEGGYIDLGKAKYNATYTGGSASGEIKAGGPDIMVLGMLPLNDDFSLYGELGMVYAKVKSDLSATGPGAGAADSYDKSKTRPIYGVGGIYNFSDSMGVRVGYERVNNLGDNNRLGDMDMNIYSVGLSYRF